MNLGTYFIIVVGILFVGSISVIDFLDERRSRIYQVDKTQTFKKEFARELRYEYRDSIPILPLNSKKGIKKWRKEYEGNTR